MLINILLNFTQLRNCQIFLYLCLQNSHFMKKIILTLGFILFCGISLAQQGTVSTSNTYSPNRWTFGGNIGITGGSYGLGFFLTPRIGYKITENFELAANVNYTMQSTQYFRNSILGVGPSLHYYIQRNFYVNSSFQHYFVSQKHKSTQETYKTNENALYVGGGYMQHLGGRTYMQLGFSYNVLYKKDKSIFSTGFIPNVGIIIGL